MPGSFLLRSLGVAALVLLTYNPTRFSYLHWLIESQERGTLGAPHALAGVVVIIGWVFVLQASYRSLGPIGILLGGAFFGTLVWFLIWLGVLQLGARSAITWAAMLCLAGILSIGISWSHVRRRITGQVDVDEVDTR